MVKKRAMTEKAKNDKREKLLQAAIALLEEGTFPLPSVNQIIKQAKEAKGTFYLYFKSKEEIFLSAMAIDFSNFKIRVIEQLQNQNNSTAKILAKEFFRFADLLPKIIYLAHITPLVLENNVSDEFIIKLKKDLLEITLEIAEAIQRKDGTPKNQAKERFLISYNLFLGMRQHSVPPRHVNELIVDNNLTALYYNFEKKFLETLEKIWN